MVLTGLSILLLGACMLYLILTLMLVKGLKVLKAEFNPNKELLDHAETALTILVAHFNDSEKIPTLLSSLEAQTFSLPFTLCIIDDNSTIAHLEPLELYLEQSSIKSILMHNEGVPGKKKALSQAIGKLPSSFIIQLDADVALDPNFLQELMDKRKLYKADMLLALVKMRPQKNFISHFAAFEFLSLQMSGLALAALKRPIMANGAAMAYTSEIWSRFKKVGEDWSSGDDSFLVQAAAKDKSLKIATLTEASVSTDAPNSWKEFFNQRIRWGAKAVAYPSIFAQYIALTVAFFNLSLVFSLITALVFSWASLPIVLSFFLLKAIIDYPLLRSFAKKTGQEKLVEKYMRSALFYPFYISVSIIFIILPTKKRWKGRVYH